MSETKTDPRPMTPAEARALEALVEWRRLEAVANDAPFGSKAYGIAVLHAGNAEDAVRYAADAVVAEREVQRGA